MFSYENLDVYKKAYSAVGTAKFSERDRKNFYVTARGSAFECACLTTFLYEEGEIPRNYLPK